MDFFPAHTVTGFAHTPCIPWERVFSPIFIRPSPRIRHPRPDTFPLILCRILRVFKFLHTPDLHCVQRVHECYFSPYTSQQVLDVAQTTDVISIKRRHPIANVKKYRPSSSSSLHIFWGQKPFFFLLPQKA